LEFVGVFTTWLVFCVSWAALPTLVSEVLGRWRSAWCDSSGRFWVL